MRSRPGIPRRLPWLVAALAIAAPASMAAAPYPLTVRLHPSAEALRASFIHDTPGFVNAPPNPSCTVPIGEQARDAYVALSRNAGQCGDVN